VMFEIFSGLSPVASRGKKSDQGEGRRPGKGVDDRSMAWGCDFVSSYLG